MTAERVFVFGSNLAGIHGRGSALEAKKNHGAIDGVGAGLQGNSWAIPTKRHWRSHALPLPEIAPYVRALVHYAIAHPDTEFDVVRVGCGLAGYDDTEVAILFDLAPVNMHLPKGWREIIREFFE